MKSYKREHLVKDVIGELYMAHGAIQDILALPVHTITEKHRKALNFSLYICNISFLVYVNEFN